MTQNASPVGRPVEILLVEDNPGDVRLTKEALVESKVHNNLTVARDGVEALAVLRREGPHANAVRPDLILLDLNLPRKDGREVLEEIKADESLRTIPVVVLTTSRCVPWRHHVGQRSFTTRLANNLTTRTQT